MAKAKTLADLGDTDLLEQLADHKEELFNLRFQFATGQLENSARMKQVKKEIARVLNVSMRKIDRVKKRFVEDGYEIALIGKKVNRVYARKTDGDFEANLVALSCSEPPEGHARWSLRLLSDRVVELNYIDSISHEAIRRILKKTKSSGGDKRGG